MTYIRTEIVSFYTFVRQVLHVLKHFCVNKKTEMKKLMFIALMMLSSRMVEAKVYAMIIGVENYYYQNSLRHAKDDAILFYETMSITHPGMDAEWNVLLDRDATPEKVVAHFIRYINIIKEDDTFVFYYSGHGLNEGIYVADDFGKSGLLLYSDLKLAIKLINAKNKLLFLDSCNSGAIVKESVKQYENEKFRPYSRSRKSQKSGVNVMLFLGSGVEENSVESSAVGHGIFTFFLCYGMAGGADFNKDKKVQIDELFYFFRNNTFEATKLISSQWQCPLLIGNFDKKLVIANLND